MKKEIKVWRRSNTYGLLFIGFCCGVAIGATLVML
tara:strand:- start:538 stop:642 length:105 start_codon:yes stop_codon:yes gene_type:complete